MEGSLNPDRKTISGGWRWSAKSPAIPLSLDAVTGKTSWAVDHAAHKATFLSVEPGVKLEVLDWGGTGRPLVLLAGLGDTAHVFDTLAAKLAVRYHVYGITRRAVDMPQLSFFLSSPKFRQREPRRCARSPRSSMTGELKPQGEDSGLLSRFNGYSTDQYPVHFEVLVFKGQ